MFQFYKEKRLCLLGVEFSDLDVFARVLKVTNKRLELLQSFQVSILRDLFYKTVLFASISTDASACISVRPNLNQSNSLS